MAKELKNLLVNFIHDRELKREASNYLKGHLIDIGCGTKPYKDLLSPYVTWHVGLNHTATLHDKSSITIVFLFTIGIAFQFTLSNATVS